MYKQSFCNRFFYLRNLKNIAWKQKFNPQIQ